MPWRDILDIETPDFSAKSAKSPSNDTFSHYCHKDHELEDESVFNKIARAGVPEKWRDYLLERVEILIAHESYSREEAQEEVAKMIPYYKGLN